MGQTDLSEKILVAYDDVFADIVNVLMFNGQKKIQPEELEDRGTKDFYKEKGMLHELERDVVKRWRKGEVRFACIGIENQTAADKTLIDEAIKRAEKYDTVLVFVGLTDYVESEGCDRENMRLPENQLALIDALIKKGKKAVNIVLYII